ncbi:hypothetical protein [Embleya sp. NPDC001921]
MSTRLATVEPRTETDEPEIDEHGFEKWMTVAEFAEAEGISTKTAYDGFKRKGWPHRDGLGPMKVSHEDRAAIREMCRRVNEPVTNEQPKGPRAPRKRTSTPRRRRKSEAA